MFTRRQVHHRISAPADSPGHFFYFFFNRGSNRRITDISIDLHQEITTNDHGLDFLVIDICRDNGPATGNLGTHKLSCNLIGDYRAKIHACMAF